MYFRFKKMPYIHFSDKFTLISDKWFEFDSIIHFLRNLLIVNKKEINPYEAFGRFHSHPTTDPVDWVLTYNVKLRGKQLFHILPFNILFPHYAHYSLLVKHRSTPKLLHAFAFIHTYLQMAFTPFLSLSLIFFSQQKLRSTAVVTACSIGAFVGIGVYKNNETFYDRYLMPMVQMCSPELCHRVAVLGFKYNLFPRQKHIDSDRLVNVLLLFMLWVMTTEFQLELASDFLFVSENQIFPTHSIESDWHCRRFW